MTSQRAKTLFLSKNIRLLTANKAIPSNENGSCLYVPMPVNSTESQQLLLKRMESGGLLKLSHPETGQEVLVPVQPCQVQGDTVTPVDDLTPEELQKMNDILSHQESNEDVEKTKSDAALQQADVMMNYKTKIGRRSSLADDASGPRPLVVLPAAHLLTFPNLNFTSLTLAASTVNRTAAAAARTSLLRLRADSAPSLGALPTPPEPAPAPALRNILETLEAFAADFRKRRVALGFTQGDVCRACEVLYEHDLCQTTVSRFEALNLSYRTMRAAMPVLRRWLRDVEAAAAREAAGEAAQEPAAEGEEVRRCLVTATGRERPLEVAVAPGWPEMAARRKRKRTKLDREAVLMLEAVYQRTKMPSANEVSELAECLALPTDVIKSWFCNRRAKCRRAAEEKSVVRPKDILNIDGSELTIVPKVEGQ